MNDTLTIPARDREHERVLGIVFDISPSQSAVLSCLARATLVTGQELMDYVGQTSHIKVVVSRTRTKLKAFGLEINSKQEVGYWLTPEDKKTIEKMANRFLEGK